MSKHFPGIKEVKSDPQPTLGSLLFMTKQVHP